MLTQISTEKGIVSFNNEIIDQIIQEALKPYKGSAWLAHYKGASSDWSIMLENYEALAEKKVQMTERGVFVRLYLLLKVGTSIQEVLHHVTYTIADMIENQLQLPLDNVELIVSGMVSKRAVKRNIVQDYRSLEAKEYAKKDTNRH